MDVGYVVVDWKTRHLACGALRSVARHRPEAPRVLVDAAKLKAGYSEACNLGVELLSGGDVVCFLNADVEMLEPDDAVLELFASDPKLAIVGPRQINNHGLINHGGIVPYEDGGEWDLDLRHRCWLMPLLEAEELTSHNFEVPTVSGSVLYARLSALRQLGFWPEWTSFYYEDTWLCYAARHAGWRVLYAGCTTWRHLGGSSPLTQEERLARMLTARQLFVEHCRMEGIPLVEPHDPELERMTASL